MSRKKGHGKEGEKVKEHPQLKAAVTEKLRVFFHNLYYGEKLYHPIINIFLSLMRALISAIHKFIRDDCLTRASSITYTLILSFVPALTVALTIYSFFSGAKGQKDALFDWITLFLKQNNVSLNLNPIFRVISGLIDNAGKIGGVSAGVMIVSATATLRSMEASLNDIWRVRKGRPLFKKIIYYWAALTLGPVMFIAGASLAASISSFFAPFIIIWLLFFFGYLSLPNTRVSFRYAAAGAAFTGAVWVGFIFLFILYIKSFAKSTFAIYGALAAVPFSLLMVYFSSAIFLFGSELSYSLMYPGTFMLSPGPDDLERKRGALYRGIIILTEIYQRFESGKGASSLREIATAGKLPAESADSLICYLIENDLVMEHNEREYIPARSSSHVLLNTVFDIFTGSKDADGKTALRSVDTKKLNGLFNKIEESRVKIIKDITLKDVIKAYKNG